MTTFLIGRVGLLAGTLQYPGVAQGGGGGGGHSTNIRVKVSC